jgi:hypothetical protein
MTVAAAFDVAGRRRSPATIPGYHAGRAARNKGQLDPADPPTVEEIIAVMRQTADDLHGARLRALIVVLWRSGLRVQEALAFGERDLEARRGSLLVRSGKGGRRREIGMDPGGGGPRPPLNYDFWYRPRQNVLVSSEFGEPNAYESGFDIEDVGAGRYGQRLHFWNLAERRLEQTLDLGEQGLVPLEVRFLHDAEAEQGFVGATLASNIFRFHRVSPVGLNAAP